MPHVDPPHLLELALGNGASHDDKRAHRHIAVCGRCRDELGRMTRLVTAARSVQESDLPAAPPERVWRHVAQELADPPPASAPADARRTGRSPDIRRGRARLACGLLVCALLVWWHRREGRAAGAPRPRSDSDRSLSARLRVGRGHRPVPGTYVRAHGSD